MRRRTSRRRQPLGNRDAARAPNEEAPDEIVDHALRTKVSEYLVCRPDLLALGALRKLLIVDPFYVARPFSVTAEVLRRELGDRADALIERMDQTPISAGWITQSYVAEREDGYRAIVKVATAADAPIARRVRRLPRGSLSEFVDPALLGTGWLSEIARSMATEQDLRVEARNMRTFHELEKKSGAAVPLVAEALSTRKVLVYEELQGKPLGEWLRGGERAERGAEVAQGVLHGTLDQVAAAGLMHGFPHPNNVIVLNGDGVGYVDVVSLVRLDPQLRSDVQRGLRLLFDYEFDGFAAHLTDLSEGDGDADRGELRRDLREALRTAGSAERSGRPVRHGRAIREGLKTLRRRGLTLPPDVLAAYRHVAVADAVVHRLDADFDVGEAGRRRLADVAIGSVVDRATDLDRIQLQTTDYIRLLADGPERVAGLLDDLADNRLVIPVVTSEGEDQRRNANQRARLISLSIIAVSVAVLLVAFGGRTWFGAPASAFLWPPLIFLYAWVYVLLRRMS